MSEIEQYHLHKANPEKLQFQVYDLNSYRKKNKEKAAEPHSHSYYQIIWFLNGGEYHTVDFKKYPVNENMVLFVTKDQVHFFDDNLEVKGWLIHFNESFFMHSDVDIFLKYNIFNEVQNSCYSIDGETSKVAKSHIELILKELQDRNRFGYEDVIRYLLKSFLINLERVHRKSDNKVRLNSAYELQFFKFKELLERHYTRNLTVKGYADRLNISSKTLVSITKKISDKSPSQLISERLVLEAKRLLKFTPMQISEVAFKLGFEDVSYFVKYFKRNMGVSPGHYRNSLQ